MDVKPNGSRPNDDPHHSSRANGNGRHHGSNSGRENDHSNGRGEHPNGHHERTNDRVRGEHPNGQGEHSNGRGQGEHPNGQGEHSNGRGRGQRPSDRSYHDRPSSTSSRHSSSGSSHSLQSPASRSDGRDHYRDQPSTSRGRNDQPSTSDGGRSRYDQHQGSSTSSQNPNGRGSSENRCREFKYDHNGGKSDLKRGREFKYDQSEGPSDRPAKRPAFGERTSRKKREEFFNQAVTRPLGFNKQGKVHTNDTVVELTANFFPVRKVKNFSVTCYRIDFLQEVELRKVRGGLIFQHKATLGAFSYDGANMLYLMQALPTSPLTLRSVSRENEEYQLKLVETRTIEYTEGMFLQVLNLAVRNAMRGLNLQLVGRNFYDPAAQIKLPNYPIQIWPGYITSIRQHENNNLLLNCEISHKVMRQENVLAIIRECTQIPGGNYREAAQRRIIGSTVLTDYNNATYQVADIDWNQNPESTFETKKGPESFNSYFKRRYNLNIREKKQPLLLVKAKARDMRGGQNQDILLVPELCRATGITDAQRANFQLMREMSNSTRLMPSDRVNRLNTFNQRLQATPASLQVFRESFLELDRSLVRFQGRMLPAEPIEFGNERTAKAVRADWTNPQKSNTMFEAVQLRNWFFIYPRRCQQSASTLMTNFTQAANGLMGKQEPPIHEVIGNDSTGAYLERLEAVMRQDPSFVMFLVPNIKADLYNALKKRTLMHDDCVPTQVVVERSLKKNVLSIATKIAIQVNCKLGGIPWMVDLKLSGMMIIGFDVSHDPRNKSRSYGAMVVSMDPRNNGGRFFSTVRRHETGSSISETFGNDVILAMREYARHNNNELPKRILIYRDGVGDGDIERVKQQEVTDIIAKLESSYTGRGITEVPKVAFIIMNKRTNTRIMSRCGRNGFDNPPPGTIVDDVITLPERFDFYLVSQHSTQGTVSPTYYNVIHNTFYDRPEVLQAMTYKLCHLYYNWSGCVRIPSVIQYAKKLAFLVGQHVGEIPNERIQNLYFL